jgi:hypothetical protein
MYAALRNKIRLRKEQCSQPRRCLRTVVVSLHANSGGVAACEQWWCRCMRTVVVSLHANSGGVATCEQWWCRRLRTVVVSLHANSGSVDVCEQWWCRYMRTVVVSLHANSGGVAACGQWWCRCMRTVVVSMFADSGGGPSHPSSVSRASHSCLFLTPGANRPKCLSRKRRPAPAIRAAATGLFRSQVTLTFRSEKSGRSGT